MVNISKKLDGYVVTVRIPCATVNGDVIELNAIGKTKEEAIDKLMDTVLDLQDEVRFAWHGLYGLNK